MSLTKQRKGHAPIAAKFKVKRPCTVKNCGDSKALKESAVREENNNDIDNITTQISKMGNFTNKLEMCCETKIEERNCPQGDYRTGGDEVAEQSANDDDYKFDEFEEDSEENEMRLETVREVPCKALLDDLEANKASSEVSSGCAREKHTQHCRIHTFNKTNVLRVPTKQNRSNMSFTNEKLRDIERENHRLLRTLTSSKLNCKSGIPPPRSCPPPRMLTSSAVSRKREEQRIQRDNLILLRKIQNAKPECPVYRRRAPGTSLNGCSCHSNSQ